MTTKSDKIAALKLEHPTLKSGGDDAGYVDLTPEEYEATIEAWAESMLIKEAKIAEKVQAENNKAALLTKLGITADEAKLLLS